MSLRVGRKWPDQIPSTIEWFYQQRSNLALERLLETDDSHDVQSIYMSSLNRVWENYAISAVIERIILDNFNAKAPITIHNVSDDYGLLVTDLLLSPYVNVINGVTDDISIEENITSRNFSSYFAPHTGGRHKVIDSDVDSITFQQPSDVVCLVDALAGLSKPDCEGMLHKAWEQVKAQGLLIVHEDLEANKQTLNPTDLNGMLKKLGELQVYSSIVSAKIQHDIEISHYSSIQESKLAEEKRKQTKVFRVVQKTI